MENGTREVRLLVPLDGRGDAAAALTALVLGDLDVDGFLDRCQKKADATKADDAIAKQTR